MATELNIARSTTTNLTGNIQDFSVPSRVTDSATSNQAETFWVNPNASKQLGYYKDIPELKKAVDALALWTTGRGYTVPDTNTSVILDHMDGWGEDTFESICFNLIICKKIFGDAFAEIIRGKDGSLVNLKVLDPRVVQIVANDKGRIKRYELLDKIGSGAKAIKSYKPLEILHLCNNRVADEIHGVSEIEAVKWVIDARNEAMQDWRRILHRSTIRIIYVDEENRSKINDLKNNYSDAIKKGEVLILPKGTAEHGGDLTAPNPETFLSWVRYLETFFYQALGVPQVVLGGSQEFTEASAKIGYLTFEQVYSKEQRELEADLWHQVFIEVKFYKPVSLKNETLSSEEKNTGQVGFQPNDTTAQAGASAL